MEKPIKIFVEIFRIFYGELFNKKNKFLTRIKRIIARFKVSNILISLIRILNQNKKIDTYPTLYKDLNINEATNKLNQEGIYKEIILPNDKLQEVLNFCENNDFNYNRDPSIKIKFNKRLKQNDLYIMNINNPHQECEAINRIFKDEKIIQIVKNYLGVNPKINSTQIFWSIPCFDQNENPIIPPNNEFGYHYDIDGFKFLKLFFYLTDVIGEDSGYHVFVRKDKKDKNFNERIFRRVSEEIIEEKYKDRLLKVFGKKGTGFFEDTSCYHKGNFPLKERGMLACIYNITDW